MAEKHGDDYESLKNEYQICQRKLESKCDALMILSRELDECRSGRDQYKLMAEQIEQRYRAIKRRVTEGMEEKGADVTTSLHTSYADMENQCLARLLCEAKEISKSQKLEIDDLKQKVKEAYGDIKLLREQIVRQRVGSTDEGLTIRHFPAYEREDLISRLETSTEKYEQLQRDLQQLIDEKEDLETERDAYKMKYERLNGELNHILNGDESRIIDIDALVTENRYLKDRVKQMEDEKTLTSATVTKYKSMLEKKKTKGVLKLGQQRSGGAVITHKQVRHLLENSNVSQSSPQALADLHALATALLETINDKNLVLNHQRKANKILGNRVSELERKLQTLEVTGMWNTPETTFYLKRLRTECEEVKTLIPVASQSSNASQEDKAVEATRDSPSTSPLHSPPWVSPDELDLLPTKENVIIEAATVIQEEINAAEASDEANQPFISPHFDQQSSVFSTDSSAYDNSSMSDQFSQLMTDLTHKIVQSSDNKHLGDREYNNYQGCDYSGESSFQFSTINSGFDDEEGNKLIAKISPEHKATIGVKNIDV